MSNVTFKRRSSDKTSIKKLCFDRILLYLSFCEKFQLHSLRNYLLRIDNLNTVFSMKIYIAAFSPNNNCSYYIEKIKSSCVNKSFKYELLMQLMVNRLSCAKNTATDACEAKSFRNFFDKYFYDDEILDLSPSNKKKFSCVDESNELVELQNDFALQNAESDVTVIVDEDVL